MTQSINIDVVSPEEQMDTLANVLAEGIVYLGERGLLDFATAPIPDSSELQKTANSEVLERP